MRWRALLGAFILSFALFVYQGRNCFAHSINSDLIIASDFSVVTPLMLRGGIAEAEQLSPSQAGCYTFIEKHSVEDFSAV